MFWQKLTNRDAVDVHRVMGRFLNRSFASKSLTECEHEARREKRTCLVLPVIVLTANDAQSNDDAVHSGLTHNISCDGMAIFTEGKIPEGHVIVGLGPLDDWHVLKCTRLWCSAAGYGYFETGLHIDKVLPTHDLEPIRKYVAALEKTTRHQPQTSDDGHQAG